jgi:hypothetical protein
MSTTSEMTTTAITVTTKPLLSSITTNPHPGTKDGKHCSFTSLRQGHVLRSSTWRPTNPSSTQSRVCNTTMNCNFNLFLLHLKFTENEV